MMNGPLWSPSLTMMTEAAPQREYLMREVFNGLGWMVRAGASWRMLPNDLLPWHVVYDQTHRWLKAVVYPLRPGHPSWKNQVEPNDLSILS